MTEITDKEKKYWQAEIVAFYALQSIHGVGFKTLYKIAEQKISFREIIKSENIKSFEKMLRIKIEETIVNSESNWDAYKKNLWATGLELARQYKRDNISVIFYEQNSFPKQLKNIPEPPMWLFVQGNLANLHMSSVAIVGSRKSTEDGMWLTTYIVAAMANLNLVSISGLADGIDQKAHFESMRFKIPTVAVLGTGINSNYPSGSEVMRAEILANNGTIISEYLINQSYSGYNFIRRNRIQAGLADIVIPVEWKIKSGTAHTVKFAKEYSRYLLMPYLFASEVNNLEIQSIDTYFRGVAFKVPTETSDLINFIINPKEKILIKKLDTTEQISLDL